jgi:arylsulfatase A-like enzyme
MDTIVRIDRLLADFLTFLDEEVGAGKYVVVLTGDHGSAPLPERVNGAGRDMEAGRFDGGAVRKAVEVALEARFGASDEKRSWTLRDGAGFRFRPETLKERSVSPEAAADVVRAVLVQQPQVAAAFTRSEILAAPAQGNTALAAVRRSYNAGRGVDVVFVLKPYVVDRSVGSNHGTPYDYDNHVPLVWYGAGVPSGRHAEWVSGIQIAPTLTGLLGVPRPPQAAGQRLF